MQISHQPRRRTTPMALSVSDTVFSIKLKMQTHLYYIFFFNCSQRKRLLGHFRRECGMWWQNLWSNVLWSWCVVLILQQTPASNTFREIRSELVIFPLHACVFYRTGMSMQDQAPWNCFHKQRDADVVHLLLKCSLQGLGQSDKSTPRYCDAVTVMEHH